MAINGKLLKTFCERIQRKEWKCLPGASTKGSSGEHLSYDHVMMKNQKMSFMLFWSKIFCIISESYLTATNRVCAQNSTYEATFF